MAAPPVGWKGTILRALVADGMTQQEAADFLRDVIHDIKAKEYNKAYDAGYADGVYEPADD